MTELTSTYDSAGNIDEVGLRTAFGRYPSGVTALCALGSDEAPIGMAASAFVGVSIDPPLVGVCIQRTSTTWPRLIDRPRIGLSVLGDGQGVACRQLASREGDRFAELSWRTTDDGALLLHGAAAWLDCAVESVHPAGDHEMVLFRVHRQCTHLSNGPLVFHASAFHGLAELAPAW
ncbi:MAG: flavin reductase [Hyphomicrobiales bacterium]|nr:MAG: flavin reductase [Hyphomicrobiales bacterium]